MIEDIVLIGDAVAASKVPSSCVLESQTSSSKQNQASVVTLLELTMQQALTSPKTESDIHGD
jgi:hypothetical protein